MVVSKAVRLLLFGVALWTAIALRGETANAQPLSGEVAAQILSETQRVADWQLAHLDTSYVASAPNDQKSQRGWVYGALFVGMSALADRSADPKYVAAIFAHGNRQDWGLEVRPFHADDYVIGQSWIWAYERIREPKLIAAVKARLDAIAASAPKVPLDYGNNPPPNVESACQLRWCWADALFMGPPAWAELSRATADPKYLSYADGEYWAAVAYLFDEKENLFARDSRFFTQRGPHGEKIFWSRGNGWVYAGLARMLQFLPRDYPSRPCYEALFRKMSERLVALQKPDGYWPVSMLAPPEGTPPETSGTGFFTFGLAYGVKAGLLPEPRFRQAAERGWAALKAAVHPDGKLGWVQPIGAAPDAVSADDTQLYGVGAFLLAGSAIYDLALEDARAVSVSSTTVWNAGYARGGINSVSMVRNNLVSAKSYQFAAFYGAAERGRVALILARRSLRELERWQTVATPFVIDDVFSDTGARDDHNIVAMAIDNNGFLHLSWGMHNAPLAYAVSAAPVLGHAFGMRGKLAFKRARMIGAQEDEVTYPEFFQALDGTLMFTYRNGGVGGGSGNGNQYINAYDAKTKTWRRVGDPMVDGISTSMNAYTNGMAADSRGTLFASWTIRETPDWQTNHDIYLACSSDNGRTWFSADGKALGPTIDRTKSDALAKIVSLPMHSSLINQTSMTIDRDGNPLIATWWAPRADNTRQFMLVWRDGASWRTSQISHRAPGEAYDATSAAVRQMGRPIVLTDKAGRVLVVTRASDAGRSIEDTSNKLVVYWSQDRINWSSVVLPTANPGAWEPTYDSALWNKQNKLSLFFQPVGLGADSSPVSVLTWDEEAYFAKRQLTIRNPLDAVLVSTEVEIPASLLPREALRGDWVVEADGKIAPLQILKRRGAVTVLDLPAQDSVAAMVRRRVPSDPAPDDFVRATIPVKVGDGYRQMPRYVVPKTHVIHDPILPIEGAGLESGRVAYRVYLDKRDAVDVYGKKLPAPVLYIIGQGNGSYHEEAAWGMDVWPVGDSLGAGGPGVMRDGMATQVGDPRRIVATVEASGPEVAALRVEDDGWSVDRYRANLVAHYSIASGSRLTMVSASATRGAPLVAGFGKYPNTDFIRSNTASGWGYVATWGQQSENGKDIIGMALFYPLAEISVATDDGRSYYVRFKNPAKARYAFAVAWVKEGGGITDEAGFRAYLDQTAAELSHPAVVTAGAK
ncbi:MAG: BNR-4 repeat-containing protein [Rhizomicrobium sp.]